MPNARDSTGRCFNLHVVGVSHRNKDGTKRQDVVRSCSAGEIVQLVPEPDNPYDHDAIRVCRLTGEQIGYIDQANACRLAGDLASGWTYRATVDRILHEPGTRSYGMMLQLEVLTMSRKTEARLRLDESIPNVGTVEKQRANSNVQWGKLVGAIFFMVGLVLVMGSCAPDIEAAPWFAGLGLCMTVGGLVAVLLGR